MELSFHGAAGGGVTGSCHLLRARGKRILVDCGLFQGERDVEDENAADFGFDPREVDYLLLTHAHLDHVGRVPLLARGGFRGEIIATSATRDLLRLVLMDAAGLQVEEARRHARRRARRGEAARGPLYDAPDVLDAIERLGRVARYGHAFELCPGVRATFGDAGHILGSSWILLEVDEGADGGGGPRRIVFSGDLGNRGKPIIRDPAPCPAADDVVMESTYGDRAHKPFAPSTEELKRAILETLDRGGNVVIPTFALERAQELLYVLRELVERRDLPRHLPVFLDSPLAISATEIFRRHPECYDEGALTLFDASRDPFALPGLRFTRETAESMAINQVRGGAVIMAGSGMATGGRILHHLKHNLWRAECAVVFVGYAAQGTLARRIIDGAERVRVYGEEIRVAARIHTIGGFSAHADRAELLAWHRGGGAHARTFLVHGEERAREALAGDLRAGGQRVELPALHGAYTL